MSSTITQYSALLARFLSLTIAETGIKKALPNTMLSNAVPTEIAALFMHFKHWADTSYIPTLREGKMKFPEGSKMRKRDTMPLFTKATIDDGFEKVLFNLFATYIIDNTWKFIEFVKPVFRDEVVCCNFSSYGFQSYFINIKSIKEDFTLRVPAQYPAKPQDKNVALSIMPSTNLLSSFVLGVQEVVNYLISNNDLTRTSTQDFNQEVGQHSALKPTNSSSHSLLQESRSTTSSSNPDNTIEPTIAKSTFTKLHPAIEANNLLMKQKASKLLQLFGTPFNEQPTKIFSKIDFTPSS